MGSKKHKKESKKKKHRSRSRSPLQGEERERKRHKKHKDRKKNRSPDVEEVPLEPQDADNGAASHSRSRSSSVVSDRERDNQSGDRSYDPERDRDRDNDPERERERAKERERPREREPEPSASGSGGGAQESMSIEDTNRLRAKLGLKPLEFNEKPAEDGKLKDDLGEFYHKPAGNLAAQRKADKLRERLLERKEKRALEQKLQTTLLAEGSDEEDASAWVMKSRVIEKQKKEAAKRAAMLDEMDEAFGVSALVAEEARAERQRAYGAPSLRGLRVAHDIDALADERETVLTLADKEVLAADDEDVLVNVNIVDDERYKKNIEERKKAKAGYQAYDDEAELQAALGYRRPVLAKYDDEIDKDKAARSRGFVISDDAALDAKRFRDMMRQERLAGGPEKRLESLMLPPRRLARDYLDEHEAQAIFKKVKRKGKMRKKPKAEPISVEDYEAGAAPLETDDTEVKPEHLKVEEVVAEEEEVEVDGELQAALARARRLRQAALAHRPVMPKVEEILEKVKVEEEAAADEQTEDGGAMVLDATAEFCRTLGDIPTYGLAGNRDHAAEIMDFEQEQTEAEAEPEVNAGAWSRVDVNSDKPADLAAGGGGGLEAEPALGAGVAGALRLALSKGYLERAGTAPAPPPRHTALPAAVYSIEDKTLGDDDKYGRRERGHGHGHGHSGPLTEFREKAQFRPSIKLEYVDDDGRALCPKEAFRYLSHKFHGKGPGKNKQEKRIKKQLQEGLMKKMSSTDTPLGTLHMLQQKQRETHSPYVLLSGAKKDPAV